MPETTTVGSRCPHCGVLFGGERTEYHTMQDRNDSFDFPRGIVIAVISYAVISFILPFILIFALDTDRSVSFYFSYVCIAISIAASAAIVLHNVNRIRSGDFNWSDYLNPGVLFIGISWTIVNVLLLITTALTVINGTAFESAVISIGLSWLVGGGFIGAMGGVILSIPVMLYQEFKNR